MHANIRLPSPTAPQINHCPASLPGALTPLPLTPVCCAQVQWFERKDNSPEDMRAGMHDKEVLESDCCDNNLVGCIDRKIQVVKARSYEEVGGCGRV